MASCMARWTMAKSKELVGPGRTATAMTCAARWFQSTMTSAPAGPAQIRHAQVMRETIFISSLLIAGSVSCARLAPGGRDNAQRGKRLACFVEPATYRQRQLDAM